MAVANFLELCRGVCELAGTPPPDAAPDADGIVAVSLPFADTQVTLLSDPLRSEHGAFTLVGIGGIEPAHELPVLEAFMELNAHLLAAAAPVIGRDPVSAQVVLMWHFPLSTATPVDLYGRLVDLNEAARQVRLEVTSGRLGGGHPDPRACALEA